MNLGFGEESQEAHVNYYKLWRLLGDTLAIASFISIFYFLARKVINASMLAHARASGEKKGAVILIINIYL